MRANRIGPILSYDLRLPDEAQSDALRLLDTSRAVVNATLTQLWPSLDVFAAERTGQAWKQVSQQMGSPDPHGDRQWRCESETAGASTARSGHPPTRLRPHPADPHRWLHLAQD